MNFNAELTISGTKYDVLNCSFNINRHGDPEERQSANVFGGRITFEIKSPSDTTIIENTINSQFKPFDGSVIFKKTNENFKIRELTFDNSYIVHYSERLNASDDNSMTTKFTISAATIKLENAEHDNH